LAQLQLLTPNQSEKSEKSTQISNLETKIVNILTISLHYLPHGAYTDGAGYISRMSGGNIYLSLA
jgi:hypothetical protein